MTRSVQDCKPAWRYWRSSWNKAEQEWRRTQDISKSWKNGHAGSQNSQANSKKDPSTMRSTSQRCARFIYKGQLLLYIPAMNTTGKQIATHEESLDKDSMVIDNYVERERNG